MHFKVINGRPYLYESIRRGRRVTSRSYGPMDPRLVPECLALRDAARRDEAMERAKAARRELARVAPLVELGREVVAYGREVEAAVSEALGLLGYHRRRRGPWRKKRRTTMGEESAIQVKVTRTNIGQLIHLASKGDALAADKLPAALAEAAARSGGDVETETACLMLDVLPAPKEPAEARVELMRRELAPPGSSPVVKLMASRVVCDWLHVQCWERYMACAWGAKAPMSTSTLRAIEKNFDAAVLRYQRSLVTFAKIQRLSLPVVGQLNIAAPGATQINQATVGIVPPGAAGP
jgi:hypothetical protein